MEYTDGTVKFKVNSLGAVSDALKAELNDKQDKLTFDTTPTESSTNPVTSDGIKKAIDSYQTSLDGINNELKSKQDKLTFDATPTESSTNPVTSDGIKKAIDAKTVFVNGHLVFPNGEELWVE